MALVKTQIWSPDEVDSCGGFQPFGSTEEPGRIVQSDSGFQVSPDYIRDLMVDPQVKIHLDSIVEERTKTHLLKLLRSLNDSPTEKKGESDLKDLSVVELEAELKRLEVDLIHRWNSHVEQIQEKRKVLETAWEKVLGEWTEERKLLLRGHEKSWCETLGYVVKKACLNNTQYKLENLEKWLSENVSEFVENEKITIFVDNASFDSLKNEVEGQSPSNQKWTVMQDSQLEPGQVRFEAENAGVVFDNKKNLDEILGWIKDE